MKRSMPFFVAQVLFGILLFQVGGAVAQQPSQAQANAIRQSCRSDYQAHCSGVPTGGSAALQCLQSNLSQLSPSCQTAVGAVSGGASANPPSTGAPSARAPSAPPSSAPPPMTPREKMAIMRRSCGGDFRAYCRGVPLGGGAGMRCLEENQSRLSPACKDVLAQAGGAR
jgi:Cysteine rich repeat